MFACDLLGLLLKTKSAGVPKLGIAIVASNCHFELLLSQGEIPLALINVTEVKVDLGILIVILSCFDKLLLGQIEVLRVEVSHAEVLLVVGEIVRGEGPGRLVHFFLLQLDGRLERCDCCLILLCLEQGQTEVVLVRWIGLCVLACQAQSVDRGFEDLLWSLAIRVLNA